MVQGNTSHQSIGKIRNFEVYVGHQSRLLQTLTCNVGWKGSMYTQKQLAVVQSKKIGLIGKDRLLKQGMNEKRHIRPLTCCEGLQSSCEVNTRITVNFLQSQQNISTSSRQSHREAKTDGQTGHSGYCSAMRSHECITNGLEGKEMWRTEIFRGHERAPNRNALSIAPNRNTIEMSYSFDIMEKSYSSFH